MIFFKPRAALYFELLTRRTFDVFSTIMVTFIFASIETPSVCCKTAIWNPYIDLKCFVTTLIFFRADKRWVGHSCHIGLQQILFTATVRHQFNLWWVFYLVMILLHILVSTSHNQTLVRKNEFVVQHLRFRKILHLSFLQKVGKAFRSLSLRLRSKSFRLRGLVVKFHRTITTQ